MHVGVIPAHQGQIPPVQLLVDARLDPLGLLRPDLIPVDQAGEGVGDGQVVVVRVPEAKCFGLNFLG